MEKKVYNFKGTTYPCSTSVTMGIIGGKWKSVILFHLIGGKLRYAELRRKIPHVTERTLSLQLKKLEEDGVVNRKVHTKKPPMKVEYSLTKFGETLIPLLNQIGEWGNLAISEYSE